MYKAPETDIQTEAIRHQKEQAEKGEGRPAIETLMEELVGLPYSTYWGLHTKGLTSIIKTHGAEILHAWPGDARKNLAQKYKKVFNEALLAEKIRQIAGITPEPDPTSSGELENGYVHCPVGAKHSGKQVSAMVVCGPCEQQKGCPSYEDYAKDQQAKYNEKHGEALT